MGYAAISRRPRRGRLLSERLSAAHPLLLLLLLLLRNRSPRSKTTRAGGATRRLAVRIPATTASIGSSSSAGPLTTILMRATRTTLVAGARAGLRRLLHALLGLLLLCGLPILAGVASLASDHLLDGHFGASIAVLEDSDDVFRGPARDDILYLPHLLPEHIICRLLLGPLRRGRSLCLGLLRLLLCLLVLLLLLLSAFLCIAAVLLALIVPGRHLDGGVKGWCELGAWGVGGIGFKSNGRSAA